MLRARSKQSSRGRRDVRYHADRRHLDDGSYPGCFTSSSIASAASRGPPYAAFVCASSSRKPISRSRST